jgi:hypothetical protein
VGGALIKESVKIVTGGTEILDLWLKALLGKPLGVEQEAYRKLSAGSFFRVYFGEPGRTIAEINQSVMKIAPRVKKVSAVVGQNLPLSSKEIFLGQALWSLDLQNLENEIELVNEESLKTIEVVYE